jgi:hypothetical protein
LRNHVLLDAFSSQRTEGDVPTTFPAGNDAYQAS